MGKGLIIAAPASGSGKTTLTLGLLRLLARRGVAVATAKAGPDYIDPAFHAAASGRACVNLDSWAMRPATLAGLVAGVLRDAELVVVEGVMGLFDGAFVETGKADGSTASLAAMTGWPVVLVVDGRGMTGSAAAVVAGFAGLRSDVRVAGVVFNRVSSERHRAAIAAACRSACPQVQVLGFLPPHAGLETPSRHLGLVQATERKDLESFLDGAADLVERHLDLDAFRALACLGRHEVAGERVCPLPPLGQRIAVASDEAFTFAYPWVLEGWRRMGADILPFAPLAGQGPDETVDAVYLPGGYPELHAGRLAASPAFLEGVGAAAARGAFVYGECGGYMVLGRRLEDGDGQVHAMAGLLELDTSFARRRIHLGYRRASLTESCGLGNAGHRFRGHEFHYAVITRQEGRSLFHVADAAGTALEPAGLRQGNVAGSFLHLMDRA